MAHYLVYSDESGDDNHHPKVAIGAIMLREDIATRLKPSIWAWRERRSLMDEMKFGKTDQLRLPRYKDFTDRLFRHIYDRRIRFCSIVFPKSIVNSPEFCEGSPHIGFNKCLYHLYYHKFCGPLAAGDSLAFYPDVKSSPAESLAVLRRCLVKALERDRPRDSPRIHDIQPVRESEKCCYIQIADLLSGAVRHQVNNICDLTSKRGAAKDSLARYIAEKACVSDFRSTTPWGNRDFQVWHFELQNGKTP